MKRALGIYIHWPFCKSKCPYCDFSSYVPSEKIDQSTWVRAYISQIRHLSSLLKVDDYELKSIFFGGGTPSLMEASTVCAIILFIKECFCCSSDLEITLEANPSSSEVSKLNEFKSAGVNRVSIGVQSFRQSGLDWLGRTHSVEDAMNAVLMAGKIFENYSFDLIYGLKDQTLNDWQSELLEATKMAKNHLSVYSLAIEQNTKFFDLHAKNELDLPPSEVADEMFLFTKGFLNEIGFVRYEISNYAKSGWESVHNMLYWQSEDYIGIGPSAVGRFFLKGGGRFEVSNVKNPYMWINNVWEPQNVLVFNRISEDIQIEEVLMMGLRVCRGINVLEIEDRIGIKIMTSEMIEKVKNLCSRGMLSYENGLLAPTFEGMNVLNSVLKHLFE